MVVTSFAIFLALFLAIGVSAFFFRKSTTEDYLLCGRSVPGWLVALSYGATISSGATFIGFAGLSYKLGVVAFYATMGLMLGDYIGWRLGARKIREVSEKRNVQTYQALLGRWIEGKDYKWVTRFAGVLTIIFLGTYCAAQFVAGGKVLHTIFGWDYNWGVLMGAGVLLMYCFAGGIRASIWTDAVQSIVLIGALALLLTVALIDIGGFSALWQKLNMIDPKLTNWTSNGSFALAAGWIMFGVGVIGQPQLMVRMMAMRDVADLKTSRRIYMTWRTITLIMATLAGLVARVLLGAEGFDPELSMPMLWQQLLPPVLVLPCL